MNSRGYTKLFSSIVTSSMWSEDSDTRIVWVTMLALVDQYGEVAASVPGLARAANVPLGKCQAALKLFLAPDEFSRTKDFEGRRIEEINGGWRILNYESYRERMSLEERKEYKRKKQAEYRSRRGQSVDKRGQNVDCGGQNRADTHTDTDSEADTEVNTHTEEAVSESKIESDQTKVEVMLKINGWFKRRPETVWSSRELQLLEPILKSLSKEDFKALGDYYGGNPCDFDRRRTSVVSLLSNWSEEVDRAKNRRKTNSPAVSRKDTTDLDAKIFHHPCNPKGSNYDRRMAIGPPLTDQEKQEYQELLKSKNSPLQATQR